MADIKAFRGVVYNPKNIASLEDVVAPPYDVINEEKREALYNKHPENIVRLILGKESEGDNQNDNKYTRAKGFLKKWMEEKSLIQDEKPAIYLYNQEYFSEGKQRIRKGYIALIKLEEFKDGIILPHEATLPKPVEDRLNLFRATQCNLSPVFGLYSDKERHLEDLLSEIEKTLLPVTLKDGDGAEHEMRKFTDTESIAQIIAFMKKKKIIIADGHHRYTTALAYKKEMEERHGKDASAPYNFVMMFLTNMYGGGISVGPIHRLVHGVDFNRDHLLESLEKLFDLEETQGIANGNMPDTFSKKLNGAAKLGTAFGLYLGKGDYCLLKPKEGVKLSEKVLLDGPEELKLLDVSIMHSLLIEGILKISKEDVLSQKHIIYKKDANEAIKLVDDGTANMAFLMNPTRVDQVEAIAGEGYLMPQKSTFFYPKLLTGLVLSPIWRASDN